MLAEIMSRDAVFQLRRQLCTEFPEPVCKQLAHFGAEDPGERTFLTVYDIWNGVVWYCGDAWTALQERSLLFPIDKLKSERDTKKWLGTLTDAEDQRYTELISSRWRHLECNRRKLHKTLARLYGALFKVIIRPDFRTGGLTRRHRRLSGPISRRLRTLGFCEFKSELEQVAVNTDMVIMVVNESFTSKICGSCGFYHRSLGKSKTFHCPNCLCKEERGQ
jgi:putative transposase